MPNFSIHVKLLDQDGHAADQRLVHDLQRVRRREHEQAGVRLLLERLDKEGSNLTFDLFFIGFICETLAENKN